MTTLTDLEQRQVELLKRVGYTVHWGDNTDPMHNGWWFCWSDGRMDIEAGETVDSERVAWMSALDHWFSNARIPAEGEAKRDADITFR